MNIILEVYYLLGDLRYIAKRHLIKTGCHLIDFEVLYEACFFCSSQSIYCGEFSSNIEHSFSLVIFMNNSWHRVSTLTLFFSMTFCIFRSWFSLERMRLFRSFWMALNFTKTCLWDSASFGTFFGTNYSSKLLFLSDNLSKTFLCFVQGSHRCKFGLQNNDILTTLTVLYICPDWLFLVKKPQSTTFSNFIFH